MSRLKLYWPEEQNSGINRSAEAASEESCPDDMLIPFRLRHACTATASHVSILDVVTRAQMLRENRECPDCGHPVVEPVELNDAAHNLNGLPIPGTATLVGFHCTRCDREWPV